MKPLKFTNVYREQSYLADYACCPMFWVFLATAYALLMYLVGICIMLTTRLITFEQAMLDAAPFLPFSIFHLSVISCIAMSVFVAYVGSYTVFYRRVIAGVAMFSVIIYSFGLYGANRFIENAFG